MRTLGRRVAATALMAVFALPGVSTAAGPPVVLTGSGHNYWPGDEDTPEGSLTITPGSSLSYLNLDEHDHTLTSVRKKSRRPLFDTGETATGETRSVTGVEALRPGRYPFFCLLHPEDMRGVLVVDEL